MSDSRLERWLTLTEATLTAPAAALETLLEQRAELRASLTAKPAPLPDPRLAKRLQDAERVLQQRLAELRAELLRRLGDIRQLRQVASGYRPTSVNRAGFVSRSV